MCSLRRRGDFLKVDFRFKSDKFSRRPMSKFLIFVQQKGLGQEQPHQEFLQPCSYLWANALRCLPRIQGCNWHLLTASLKTSISDHM